MGNRAALIEPISESEQWAVTAYPIGVSPRLMLSASERRAQEQVEQESQQAASTLAQAAKTSATPADPAAARELLSRNAHSAIRRPLWKQASRSTSKDARELVQRIVTNGLTAAEAELGAIIAHLTAAGR